MNLLKKLGIPILCFLAILTTLINLDRITNVLVPFIEQEPKILKLSANPYKKDTDFLFVSNVNDFTILSKKDLKNVFYTIVNSGWKEFTFYCPKEYTHCLEDVREFSQNQNLLTHINNYVHPFNGFSNIQTTIRESGQITVHVTYFYSEDFIEAINQKVDALYKELIIPEMDARTKIKTIHDYLINTTKYDVLRNDGKESIYQSYLAYGPLFEGYATCNGYTDAMALFLDKMGIPNFKVATTPEDPTLVGHVWNAVYINGQWLHLDLTWDDPISNDGSDYLQDKYFLITTDQLEEIDGGEHPVTEHQFKKEIYLEFKK